jgi:hypothetical protein
MVGACPALGLVSGAVAGSAVGISGDIAAIVAATVGAAEMASDVAAAAVGGLVAAGLTADVQPTKATRTTAASPTRSGVLIGAEP